MKSQAKNKRGFLEPPDPVPLISSAHGTHDIAQETPWRKKNCLLCKQRITLKVYTKLKDIVFLFLFVR